MRSRRRRINIGFKLQIRRILKTIKQVTIQTKGRQNFTELLSLTSSLHLHFGISLFYSSKYELIQDIFRLP